MSHRFGKSSRFTKSRSSFIPVFSGFPAQCAIFTSFLQKNYKAVLLSYSKFSQYIHSNEFNFDVGFLCTHGKPLSQFIYLNYNLKNKPMKKLCTLFLLVATMAIAYAQSPGTWQSKGSGNYCNKSWYAGCISSGF